MVSARVAAVRERRLKGSAQKQHRLVWWQSLRLSPDSPINEHCHLGFFIYEKWNFFFYGFTPKLLKAFLLNGAVIFGMVILKI